MKIKTKLWISAAVVAFVGAMVGGYLALVYVPDWYEPAYVSAADQQKLRDDLTAITTKFNNRMQHPEKFDFTISAAEINRLLSGMAYLDPKLKDAIPSNVDRPAVQFDNDTLDVGAVVEQDGRKVFVSVQVKVVPLEKWLILDTFKVRVGKYPLPRDEILEKVGDKTDKIKRYLPFFDELMKTGQCVNRFSYPNSNYDFRVRNLRAKDGKLYMTIEPLPKAK
jgi:hypothetical protein